MRRYWAVTYPHYIHSRNSTSIWMLISTVWIMSIIVSLAPLLGWKDENWSERVTDGKCMVSRGQKAKFSAAGALILVPRYKPKSQSFSPESPMVLSK